MWRVVLAVLVIGGVVAPMLGPGAVVAPQFIDVAVPPAHIDSPPERFGWRVGATVGSALGAMAGTAVASAPWVPAYTLGAATMIAWLASTATRRGWPPERIARRCAMVGAAFGVALPLWLSEFEGLIEAPRLSVLAVGVFSGAVCGWLLWMWLRPTFRMR